jgi:K+-transporting ATPase A subunit
VLKFETCAKVKPNAVHLLIRSLPEYIKMKIETNETEIDTVEVVTVPAKLKSFISDTSESDSTKATV